MRAFSPDEDYNMWKYLLSEVYHPITKQVERERIRARGLNFWEKFKNEYGSARSAISLRRRYSMATFPTPFEMDFTHEDRIKLMYAYSIPVDEHLWPLVSINADVELDESKKIIRYKERIEGGLELYLVARPNWVLQRRKTAAAMPSPLEIKKWKPDETNHFHNVEESYANQNINSEWMLQNHEIKAEPMFSSSAESLPTSSLFGESTSRMDRREPSMAPMQDFFLSLRNVIVDSHSTMLNAVQELVPNKEDITDSPSKNQPEMKIFETQNNQISKKEYLEQLNDMLSNYQSTELDEVKEKLKSAIKTSDKDELPVKRVKLMMETMLAMMGY
uniref:SPK domain-containing protein n=1 Tax=Caenorhabditis japonica TaxID=281687 RepID=A0A8R1DUZ7_CAEJA